MFIQIFWPTIGHSFLALPRIRKLYVYLVRSQLSYYSRPNFKKLKRVQRRATKFII